MSETASTMPCAPDELPTFDDNTVVGLGASAGGIRALKQFFSAVADNSGMVYVVILHLSPEHESHLAQVLQQATPLPVTQVRARVRIAPNQVYVVSPNNRLFLADGHIEVMPMNGAEERRAPVDMFFRTLAEAQRTRAISVILSGTGANGSMGMKRIKECGGICVVQEPTEADFSDMPRNAIATGLVDYVLPATEIPARLVHYHSQLNTAKAVERDAADEYEKALSDVFALLRVRTSHDFTNYKRSTVLRRIERRINVQDLHSIVEYARYLRENREEARLLLRDLLISVTNFFRDPESWAALERHVVPKLFDHRTSQDHVRVWAAGCATGEEAYSTAMLLAEQIANPLSAPTIQVFATDIDHAALAKARSGLYTLNDAADVPPERLRRFFIKEGDSYRVRRELREMVLFAPHNVLVDPPFSHLDLVTCRNLLIYLNRAAQDRILRLFHFALNPDGFLFLGNSESAEDAGNLYVPLYKEHHIFQSRNVETPVTLPPVSATTLPAIQWSADARAPESRLRERMSYQELHQCLLEHYAAPSVVVGQDYDILHLSEHAGRYLQFVGGEPSQNLLKVVRSELRLELHSALNHAAQYRTSAETIAGPIQIDGATEHVKLIVRPVFSEIDTSRGMILVLFETIDGTQADEPARVGDAVQRVEPIARQLEEELMRVKLKLRTTIEQHELQQEELKASNEELQAMNEELRSSGEELETSKEELQSLNEELTTVNQELKIKIDELSAANNDTRNLMNSTDIATVFVDRAMRIKLFTPRARSIFNLIPADAGRPLMDITHRLTYRELVHDIERVLDTLSVGEREVEATDGHWYIARVLPYRTADDRIVGVVLTFTDITERRRAEQALRESEESLRAAHEQLEARVVARTQELAEANAALRREMDERVRAEAVRVRLLRRLVRAQEEERRRISRELHDQLGQEITALGLQLAAMKSSADATAPLRAQIAALEDIVKRLDSDVDFLVWELRPTALDDLGLSEALSDYIASWSKYFDIPVRLQSRLTARLPAEMETVLYRIAQEALNNVAKHAQATEVELLLERDAADVSLVVKDNGVGFDISAPVDPRALGLLSMRERAGLVSGTVEIDSGPGGTTVRVCVPAWERHDAGNERCGSGDAPIE